jgi:hypothetical protein
MDKPVEVFEIDSNTRITAYHDTYGGYALEDLCGDDFGVQTLNIARGYNDISTKDEVEEAVRRVKDSIHYFNHEEYADKRERVIGAWLSAKGYAYEFVSLRGYSQGEWADVVIYTPNDNAEYLKYRKADLQAWFRGDVYVIARENLETYVNTIDSDNSIERWEIADSIGGVMLDLPKDLESFAKDTWDLVPV